MKLQEKLERMTMTAFERRLLKQWLAANEEPVEEQVPEEACSTLGSDPNVERPESDAGRR